MFKETSSMKTSHNFKNGFPGECNSFFSINIAISIAIAYDMKATRRIANIYNRFSRNVYEKETI